MCKFAWPEMTLVVVVIMRMEVVTRPLLKFVFPLKYNYTKQPFDWIFIEDKALMTKCISWHADIRHKTVLTSSIDTKNILDINVD